MATKKKLREQLERLKFENEMLENIGLIRLEMWERQREDTQKMQEHAENLHYDNAILSNHIHDLTIDNNAHTRFISAQAEYIEHLMNR